ncbi:MAG: hypothetical protein ABEJ70_03515 [Halobacteriaceae archaeon]
MTDSDIEGRETESEFDRHGTAADEPSPARPSRGATAAPTWRRLAGEFVHRWKALVVGLGAAVAAWYLVTHAGAVQTRPLHEWFFAATAVVAFGYVVVQLAAELHERRTAF